MITRRRQAASRPSIAVLALAILGICLLSAGRSAAQTGGVTVSVTPNLPSTVAITVADGSIAFGAVSLGATIRSYDLDPAQTQTVTNTGTVSVDLAAQYVPFAGGSAVGFDCGISPPDWTPVDTVPSAINRFRMRASIDGGTSWGVFNASGLASALPNTSPHLAATSDSTALDYELRMPDSVSTGAAACTISTTILATQAGS